MPTRPLSQILKCLNISTDYIMALNDKLYIWSNYLNDKYSNNAFYRKIIDYLTHSRKVQKLLRGLSFCGYKLDISATSTQLSKKKGVVVAAIKRVSKEHRANVFIFTSHLGSSLIEETVECLFDFRRAIIDLKVVYRSYLQPEKLALVTKSCNRVVTAHVYPERYNLAILEENNVKKIVVHVADPRLRLVREVESIVNRTMGNTEQAIKVARLRYYVPENYLDLSLSDRIELECKAGKFSEMISFVNDWMEVKKNLLKEWDFDIYITSWEELVLDRVGYFDRLALFWGFGKIDWENALLSERHLIKNTTSLDWKVGLSSSLIDYINSFVSDELLEFYGWDR